MAALDEYSFEFDDGEDEDTTTTEDPPTEKSPLESSSEPPADPTPEKLSASAPTPDSAPESSSESSSNRRKATNFGNSSPLNFRYSALPDSPNTRQPLFVGGSRLGERTRSEANNKKFLEGANLSPPSSSPQFATSPPSSPATRSTTFFMSRSNSLKKMGLKTGGGRDEDDALDTDADADSAAYVEKLRAASPKKTRRRTITGAGAAAQSPAESRRVGKGASAKNLLKNTKSRGRNMLRYGGQTNQSRPGEGEEEEEEDELLDVNTMTIEESFSFCTETLGKMHLTMRIMGELLKTDYSSATGIFRISSGTAELKKAQLKILKHYQLPSSSQFERQLDLNTGVHTLAALLKRYFREVEPPIIPYTLYSDVIAKGKELFIKLHEKLSEQEPEEESASSSSSLMDGNHPQFDKLCHKDMLGDLFDLIWSLPAANRTIFCWLMVCLFGVSLCEEETKMGPENIALVFGPNLMRFSANPTPTESMKMLEDSSVITLITGVLIRHARDLFSFVKTKEEEENQNKLMKFCPFEDNFGEVEKTEKEEKKGEEEKKEEGEKKEGEEKRGEEKKEEEKKGEEKKEEEKKEEEKKEEEKKEEETEDPVVSSPEPSPVSPSPSPKPQNLSSFLGNLVQKYEKLNQEESEKIFAEIEGELVGDKGEEGVPEGVGGVVLTMGYLVQLMVDSKRKGGKGDMGEVGITELMGLAWGEGETPVRKEDEDQKEEKEKGEENLVQVKGEEERKEEAQEEMCNLLEELNS